MPRFVAVTNHAVDQHLERFPDGGPWDKEGRRFQIANTVSVAFSEGRYSTREPRFSGDGLRRAGRTRNPKERDRSVRWCWTEDESQVFLVDRQGQNTLVVVTSIRP